MIEYPSILSWAEVVRNKPCIAFDKLDGNNVRFGWTRKQGFHKFGTRTNRIDHTNDRYGEAVTLFMDKYAEPLEHIFKKHKKYRNYREITAFCEYYGENSFAGTHDKEDDMNVTLFDIHIKGEGFVHPLDFLKVFGELGVPEVIYSGNLNQEFIQDIKDGKYDVKEGVICKGVDNRKLWMAKVKTNTWLDKVKNRYGEAALKEMGE